jgi:hypothetical protein
VIAQHLGDGPWGKADRTWRIGRDRGISVPMPAAALPLRPTMVVLTAAHLDHGPSHCGRRALGDLFSGPYAGS